MCEPIIKVNPLSTEYLYGVSPLYFKELKYRDVLIAKIELGKEKSSKLYKEQEQEQNKDKKVRLEYILNDIYKAIEHNQILLKEFDSCKD